MGRVPEELGGGWGVKRAWSRTGRAPPFPPTATAEREREREKEQRGRGLGEKERERRGQAVGV